MDAELEYWIGAAGLPALLAGLAVFAWLAVTAQRADVSRALIGFCREAVRLREDQERLKAAGKPAPGLEAVRRTEEEARALLRRRGIGAGS